jgi:hypothetical protein
MGDVCGAGGEWGVQGMVLAYSVSWGTYVRRVILSLGSPDGPCQWENPQCVLLLGPVNSYSSFRTQFRLR